MVTSTSGGLELIVCRLRSGLSYLRVGNGHATL